LLLSRLLYFALAAEKVCRANSKTLPKSLLAHFGIHQSLLRLLLTADCCPTVLGNKTVLQAKISESNPSNIWYIPNVRQIRKCQTAQAAI
jgi:hypothetical protein